MTVEEILPQKIIRAVDHRGSIFSQVVVEFMKYNAVGDKMDRIMDQLNVLKRGEQARKDTEDAKEQAESGNWEEWGKEAVRTGSWNQKTNVSYRPMGYEKHSESSGEDTKGGMFDRERYEKEWRNSVVQDVEEAKKRGILKLVLPRGTPVSGETIEKGELPSEYIPQGEALNFGNGVEDVGRELLYNVYLTSYFPSFTDTDKRNGVQYELEYIIFGEERDDKNLEASVDRLLLIREGMNVLHIIKSPEKMRTAWSMATALMGWTQIPLLVTLMRTALVGAWAYGESILDVRTLLDGGKINLLKSDEEWSLSLEGVPSFLRGEMKEGKEGKDGLTYTDYLLLLLFLENKEEKYYRTMDMVQINMRKVEPEFRMEECMFGVQMELKVQAPGIFSRFIHMPWGKNLSDAREYRFSVSRMY